METKQRIKSAAHMLIANLWHDLPGSGSESCILAWQQYFERELAQIAQDQSFYNYTGYKLISWIRSRARQLYEKDLQRKYHMQSHKLGWVSAIASQMLSVISDNSVDKIMLYHAGNIAVLAYCDCIASEGAKADSIGRLDKLDYMVLYPN